MDNILRAMLLVPVAMFVLLVFLLSDKIADQRELAIENQCALYHPQTGEFTWRSDW